MGPNERGGLSIEGISSSGSDPPVRTGGWQRGDHFGG